MEKTLPPRDQTLLKNKPLSSEVVPEALVEVEIGGPKGLEPTRFGDWERNGRCSDF